MQGFIQDFVLSVIFKTLYLALNKLKMLRGEGGDLGFGRDIPGSPPPPYKKKP